VSDQYAIEATDVTKVYRRFGRRRQFATLKSALVSGTLFRDLRPDETFLAVDHVSFRVPRGTTYGIIGRNGSGKSTMLKLVAGISKPTSGTVAVDGRISALIELGAGFHPEISGRENVFINGIMLGLSKREIARRFDEIVEFAELAEFIDTPVKNYSSGMYMRLGFAVAVHVDPDVLLVDEVLAVGDESFTHKCLDKFAEFRRRGKTILLVTHSLGLVERFCDEALWLDAGRARPGVGLFNADGVCCYGTNTALEELRPDRFEGEGEVTFTIESLDLVEGTYKLDAALHKFDGYPYDYHRLLYSFRVKSRTKDVGVYRPRHIWTFSPTIRFKEKSLPD
jgi:ABC-type polysaccharide/polyol phosphate transport system ATPase subunit